MAEAAPKLTIHRGPDDNTPQVEVPNKMSSPEKLETLGLALGKIITAKSERALGKLKLDGRLLKACQEKVEDQDLALKLARKLQVGGAE
ncbi:hypothetical protein PSHT_08196 [Puccinia striiformis]|uniref:Uncharacterized protein n=1 Tax=Puccinia striiformis TaxID=27350 RepID=A0A2S4VRE6_9BASI|nr:hypothetical protein PSHT_08196 [Puccinia striiformis]